MVAAARRHELAPVTGTVKAVGMTGLTLAGRYGPLIGKYGLALDNLVEAEVVLADGRRVVASEEADADLYWALRGGGGTFGVVTAARYRPHPLTTVLAGLILYPVAQAASVLGGYQQLVVEAPDELTVMAGFMVGPDGAPLLFLFPTWSGHPSDGEATIGELSRLGTPLVSSISAPSRTPALRAALATPATARAPSTTPTTVPPTTLLPATTAPQAHGTMAIEGPPTYGQGVAVENCATWRLKFDNNSDTEIIEITFAPVSGDYTDWAGTWNPVTKLYPTMPAATPSPAHLNVAIPANTSQVLSFQTCTATPQPANRDYWFSVSSPPLISYQWVTGEVGTTPF